MTAEAPARGAGRVVDGASLPPLSAVEVDFCVVGSGAGGSIAAAMLAEAGARVAIVEEGAHYTKRDFNMQEAWAYPALYQEHGNRATDDLAIMILQGRNVGGGTTVNWTSSFRTPPATLRLWAERHGLGDLPKPLLQSTFRPMHSNTEYAAQYARGVGIQDRGVLAVREAEYRSGGVAPDSRESSNLLGILR